MAKKKAVKIPIKVQKFTKKKKKQLPEYTGVQMESIGEKYILNRYTTNECVWYKCRFVDGSRKMVPAELLKGFIK